MVMGLKKKGDFKDVGVLGVCNFYGDDGCVRTEKDGNKCFCLVVVVVGEWGHGREGGRLCTK